jgi:hypothetical protein
MCNEEIAASDVTKSELPKKESDLSEMISGC